jgi:hypothetical protein
VQSEQDKHQEMEGPPHFAYKFLREHANASSHNASVLDNQILQILMAIGPLYQNANKSACK